MILNGEESTFKSGVISYDEIVELTDLHGYPTVTYRKAGPNGDKEGTLIAGEAIVATRTAVVNCVHTDNA